MKSVEKRFLAIGLIVGFVSGCLFAPSKCGPRGIVMPGSAQYDAYLHNCRETSDRLDAYCLKHGDPMVIQIGHSGGHFIWLDPQKMISVRSFGSTTERDSIPPSIITMLERSQALSDRVKRLAAPTSSKSGFSVRSLDYDAKTRSGIIRVTFSEGCFNGARAYARQAVEKMVNDKNVVLVSGEKAAAGLFRIGDERVLKGNLFEMEFSVE